MLNHIIMHFDKTPVNPAARRIVILPIRVRNAVVFYRPRPSFQPFRIIRTNRTPWIFVFFFQISDPARRRDRAPGTRRILDGSRAGKRDPPRPRFPARDRLRKKPRCAVGIDCNFLLDFFSFFLLFTRTRRYFARVVFASALVTVAFFFYYSFRFTSNTDLSQVSPAAAYFITPDVH